MKTPLSALLLAATALPLTAQTATRPPLHHTVPAATHTQPGACARVPEISPKIPALPAGATCAKALYTLTQTPTIKLDYASPLLSPAIHALLDQQPTTFSLLYIDTLIGAGPLAQPHKWYTVHYTGYLSDGTKFDSSLDRGEPISFPYGQHRVIEGWDTGFDGMRIGGKRRLIIPYQLAYGEAGKPPIIPARSTLIFDLELVAQSDEQPKPPAPPAPKPAPAAAPPINKPTTPPPSTTATPPPAAKSKP